MKTEPAPEIIELIDNDGDAFGDRPPAHVTNHTSGPRWVGPVAAAALVAVVGYGVVTSAISSANKTTQPTPTSVPRTTAVIAPSSAVSPPVKWISPEYYVADPPPGFTMHFAETLGMGGNTADFTNSATAELWATDDATATAGSWFVVSRGTHHSTGRNSYRIVVGGIEVVVEHDPRSGQSRLSFTKDGDELEITAFGWADRQLLRLVASVSIDNSEIHYSDEFFATDHKRILEADPASSLYGLPVAWVGYATAVPAALAESFTITVASDNIVDRKPVARFALINTTSFAVGDLPAIIGQSAADPRVSIAQWRDGERLITMRGNLDAQRLGTIAQTVHPSPSAIVKQQLDAGSASVVGALAVESKTIASGMLADGWGWAIQVSMRNPDDAAAGYLWWIGQPGDSTKPTETRLSLADEAPSIETLVEHGRTYVLAKVPRSMSGAQLHINPNGLPSAVTPLIDVDPDLADQFTAYVFLEPVPFTARIVDSNGETIASWPTT